MITVHVHGLDRIPVNDMRVEIQKTLSAMRSEHKWRCGEAFCFFPQELPRRGLGEKIYVEIKGVGRDIRMEIPGILSSIIGDVVYRNVFAKMIPPREDLLEVLVKCFDTDGVTCGVWSSKFLQKRPDVVLQKTA